MPADSFAGALLNAELTSPTVQIVAHLAKSPIPPDADSVVLADLIEADFVGYEPVVLGEASIDVFNEENYAEAFFHEGVFIAGDLIDPQVLYGCYVTVTIEGVGTVLNNVQIFEQPIVLDIEGQSIVRKFSIAATSEDAE